MTARRHHFISQCYLKGFAVSRDKPKLFVVDGKEGKSFTTSPENVAHERDFHTIEAEGWEPDAIEKNLAIFEGEVGPALERIIAARSIQNGEDLDHLINLAALFATKNPAKRENFRQFEEQVIKKMMKLSTATRERWEAESARIRAEGYEGPDVSYDDMRAFAKGDEYRIDVPTERHLEMEMKSWDRIADMLRARKWMLFRAPVGHAGFVTSDHPVCLMWSDPGMRDCFYSPGFGLKKTQVVFPISRDLVMIGAFEIDDMEAHADDKLISEINASIIASSNRQVYAQSDQFLFRFGHHDRIMRGSEMIEDLRLHHARELSRRVEA